MIRLILILVCFACFSGLAHAEVTRIEIIERASFAGGKTFGSTGAYECIKGRMFLETDLQNVANERIHDLQRAPRNDRGKVESWTDFFLLKPVDAAKGNGVLLYDVNNRGNMLALWTFNDGERTNDPKTEAHAGHGFLMKQGFSVLWCGWNGEVQADDTQRLLCGLPVATENGQTITGKAHLEITSTEKVFSRAFSWSPWGIGAAFPAVSLDNADAMLTMRPHRAAEGIEVPRVEWTFGVVASHGDMQRVVLHGDAAQAEVAAIIRRDDFTCIAGRERGHGAEERSLAVGTQRGGFTFCCGQGVEFRHEKHMATATIGIVIFDEEAPAASSSAQDVIPELVEVQSGAAIKGQRGSADAKLRAMAIPG